MKIDKLSDVQFNHILEVLIYFKKCNPEKDVYLNENSIKEALQYFMKNEMFEDIKIAIIKPGFGTVQDCLKRGIAINSFLQSNNKEFLHNAKILKKKKIGDYYFSLNSALNNAVYKFDDNKKIIKIQKICKKLSWEGEKNFQRHILKTTIYN